jgi:hypothetical protein
MDRQSVVAAGKSEAARMHASVAEADPAGNVQMSVVQFERLAELIAALARAAENLDAAPSEANPAGTGIPGDPRYWVPLAHYARTKARCDALERLASCGALGLAA